MPGRAVHGPGRTRRALRGGLAILWCAAAMIHAGVPARAAGARQIPEEKRFSTEPQLQLTGYLYAPKPPATKSSAGDPVVFFSGEWGWMPMQQEAATYLASTGRYVLGIDSPDYFVKLVPADGLAADFSKFRSFVNERAGRPRDAPVIVAGFSSGAEIVPYLVNEIGPSGVRGLVLIAPDKKGAKVFRVALQLKIDTPPDETIDVEAELRRMAPLPVAFIEGSLDVESEAKALSEIPRGPRKYAPVVGGDRKFKEVRDVFFSILADALRWIDGTPVPAAPVVP